MSLWVALAAVDGACGSADPTAAAQVTVPRRIVSLGGPVTETLFALGAGEQVVGVDLSSLYPEAATKLPRVGYYRQFSAEGVLGLRPDLVIASHEAGPSAALEHLRGAGIDVEVVQASDDLAGARARIEAIAGLVGADPGPALAKLERDLAEVEALRARVTSRPRVLFVYARGPGRLLVGWRGTPAAEVLRLAAVDNAGEALEGMKPWSAEAVVAAAPDAVVLPSRGLESLGGIDGLLAQPGLAETPAGRARRIVAVDDLKLLGFGPRIGEGLQELLRALHPELGEDG
ncbi:MAG TPA: ABC transporter substrate-binding protein [Nannocystis sp.]